MPDKGLVALAFAGAVGGIILLSRRPGTEPPPEGLSGQILSWELTEEGTMVAGEIAALLLSILSEQDFKAGVTVENTGGVVAPFMVEVSVSGPATVIKGTNSFNLNPGQMAVLSATFLRSEFGLSAWTPGTYNLTLRLYSGATLLDTKIESGALVITAPVGLRGVIQDYYLQAV